MPITLAPTTETRLRRKAARLGEEADVLADALLSDALADEPLEELREEYRALVSLELQGALSESDVARLRAITQALDDSDAHSPAAQAMFAHLEETGRKLDEMLLLLRSLPLAEFPE